MERKFIKFGSSLNTLLEEWDLLCSCTSVERVLITLGPSWSRQREHHVLDFSGLCSTDTFDTEMPIPEPGVKQEHTLSRRLTRALLDGISDPDNDLKYEYLTHPSQSSSGCTVHLSVWITHETVDSLFAMSANDGDCSSPLQALLQTCVLRPGYSITRREDASSRRKQPHVVTARVSSSDKKLDSNHWNEEDGVWISLPTSLKGFRVV